MSNNLNNKIPIAYPIYNNNYYPGIKQYNQYNTNLNNITTSSICRDCGIHFPRLEKNKGGASYFRCKKCSDSLLSRSIVNSCLIS